MRNIYNAKQNQKAYVEWLCGLPLHMAVTLNFRAGIHENDARAAARHFWRVIDTKVFGYNAVKRRGAKLLRVCTLEGEANVRNWHYHAAVHLPQGMESAAFAELLLTTWEAMREAGKYSMCKAIYDRAGWLDYICKGIGEQRDVLCLATSHLPCAE